MNDFKSALSQLKKGKIDNVYLLKGEDQFLQNFFIEKLYDAIFIKAKGTKEFLTLNEFSGKEIMDKLISSDLFGTKKLFILKDPQQIKGKVVEELISYSQDPLKNHFLVFINDNYMDKSSFSKNLQKYISSINVSTPFQNELFKWAKFFINDNKKNISDELLSQIIENCGDSLYNIKNEIDKICLISDSDNITKEHLNLDSSFSRSRKRWEMIASIGNRDLKKSVRLAKSIINNSESMISIIFPLLTLFQEILFIKMNNGTFIKPVGYIPLSASLQNNLSKYSSNYETSDIVKALRKLKEIEIKQKTSNIDDESELISFIFNVVG